MSQNDQGAPCCVVSPNYFHSTARIQDHVYIYRCNVTNIRSFLMKPKNNYSPALQEDARGFEVRHDSSE